MTEAVSDVSISFLDPPSEDQWRQILKVVKREQWHIAHWKYFLVLSELPFAKAVVSTDDQGEYVGVLVFVQPPAIHVSYVGIYIMSEKCRGQGNGQRMWKLMQEHTDGSRVVGIDSGKEMVSKYRSVYFPVAGPTWQKMNGSVADLKSALEIYGKRCPFKAVDAVSVMDDVANLDKKFLRMDRSQFLHHFFQVADDGKALVANDGVVLAYGAVSPTLLEETEIRIGPLCAEDFNTMLMLLHFLVRDVEKSEFLIKVPAETECGKLVIEFLTKKANACLTSTCYRSYDRPYNCPIDWRKVFCLSYHVAAPLA